MTKQIKYLGIIFDDKLTWKPAKCRQQNTKVEIHCCNTAYTSFWYGDW